LLKIAIGCVFSALSNLQ